MKYAIAAALGTLTAFGAQAQEFQLLDRSLQQWSDAVCTPEMFAASSTSNAVSQDTIKVFQTGNRRYDRLLLIQDPKKPFFRAMFNNAEYQDLATRYNENMRFFQRTSAIRESDLFEILDPILTRHGFQHAYNSREYRAYSGAFGVYCTPELTEERFSSPLRMCPSALPAEIVESGNITLSVECLGTTDDYTSASEVKIDYRDYRSEQVSDFFLQMKEENEATNPISSSQDEEVASAAQTCRRNPYCTQAGNQELATTGNSLIIRAPSYSNVERDEAFAVDFQQNTLLPLARELDATLAQLRAQHDVQLSASDF